MLAGCCASTPPSKARVQWQEAEKIAIVKEFTLCDEEVKVKKECYRWIRKHMYIHRPDPCEV